MFAPGAMTLNIQSTSALVVGEMKTLELTCDYCGKTEKGDESHFDLPKGWYLVGYHCQTYAGYDDWRVKFHFCSLNCMNNAVTVVSTA